MDATRQTSPSSEAVHSLCTLLKSAHLASPSRPPQGSNFDTSEQPTQYESSIERPITSIFTGAPVCGIRLERLVKAAWSSTLAQHYWQFAFTVQQTSFPAGNYVRVKKVAAYQYTMTAASSQACNETLFAAWKNDTGFDESVYQGE